MTAFEISQIIIGLIQALIGAAGIFFVVQTLKTTVKALQESQKSNDIAAENATRNVHHQRGWIKLSHKARVIERREGDLYLCMKVRCKNVGLTPIYNLKLVTHVVNFNEINNQHEFLNEVNRILDTQEPQVEGVVFPNSSKVSNFNLYLPLNYTDKNRRTGKLPTCLPIFIAAASYEIPFDDEIHRSSLHAVYAKFPDYENISPLDIDNFESNEYEFRTGLFNDTMS